MKTQILRLAVVSAVIIAAAGLAQAGVIAEYAPTTYTWMQPFYTNYIIAQSFVPTADGTVISIEATVHRHSGATTEIPITFLITGTRNSGANGLQPDLSNVLSSGTLPYDDPKINGSFIEWAVTDMSPTDLVAGVTYMLVATAGGTDWQYDWYSGASNYADGNMLIGYIGDSALGNQSDDLPFRINAADTPEPATFACLGLGLLALGALKRRVARS